jgi:sugar phosphate isomerase/epimerase
MIIGTMNHPERNVVQEIAWMAEAGMGFIDLTLEPPAASSWGVNVREIQAALHRFSMEVVGHTAWYLPIANAIPEIRHAAVTELRRCLQVFSDLGAKWMNIHPDRHVPSHPRHFVIRQNLESLRDLLPDTEKYGVGLMIENLPGDYNSASQLGELLDPLPELGLHLDIGHANLQVPSNTTREILSAYGHRLRHVHLHDNKGGHADLHLPLGSGTVDLHASISALQACGYDGTITLEVFTPDRRHLEYSRDLLRTTWDRIAAEAAAGHREQPSDETVTTTGLA